MSHRIIFVLYLLATGAGVAHGQTVSPDVGENVPLWHGLTQGMSYEETGEILRSIEGVKAAKVLLKKQQAVGLEISYSGSGVAAGPMMVTVHPKFENSRLLSVSLMGDDCLSAAIVKNKTISDALSQKYGSPTNIRVVDSDGAEIEERKDYSDGLTGVIVSWQPHNDAADALAAVGHSGASGTLGRLADSLAITAAKQAIAVCPHDKGDRVKTVLTYESQANLIKEAKAFRDRQAADKLRTKNSL